MDKLTPTQEDREAAANAAKAYRGQRNGDWQARIRRGECDDGELVQAFARHRFATEQRLQPSGRDIRQSLAAGEGGDARDRARELLAAELRKTGFAGTAAALFDENQYVDDQVRAALRAIEAALSLSRPPAGEVELRGAGQFLADRIWELGWSQGWEEFQREWNGHVEPAFHRFRKLLTPKEA